MLPRAKVDARPVMRSAEAQKILERLLEAASAAPAASGWVFPSPDEARDASQRRRR
jgi:hypothetical protein